MSPSKGVLKQQLEAQKHEMNVLFAEASSSVEAVRTHAYSRYQTLLDENHDHMSAGFRRAALEY